MNKGDSEAHRETSFPAEHLTPDYWCFISYRHSDNQEQGREWATWLHQKLETYQVPEDLVGTLNDRGDQIPGQIYPVFRDEEELGAGYLKDEIYKALDNSKSIVVICSPRALESSYVADEIRYFKARHAKAEQTGTVAPFAVIIEGDPLQAEGAPCLPEPLLRRVDEGGGLTNEPDQELLWIDFRTPLNEKQGWTTPEAYRAQLRTTGIDTAQREELVAAYANQLEEGVLRLIAGILGVQMGELSKRDKAYQLLLARRRMKTLRRWLMAVSFLVVIATVAAIFAVVNRNRAERNLTKSRHNEARAWHYLAQSHEKEGNHFGSALLAAKALGYERFGRAGSSPAFREANPVLVGPGREVTANLEALLQATASTGHCIGKGSLGEMHSGGVSAVAFSPGGFLLATGGNRAGAGPGSLPIGEVHLWDLASGKVKHSLAPFDFAVHCLAFSPDGSTLAVGGGVFFSPTPEVSRAEVTLWNVATGRLVAREQGQHLGVTELAFSPRGDILATSSWDGSVAIRDGAEATVQFHLPGPEGAAATALAFSPDGASLAAGFQDHQIWIRDITTREIKARWVAHQSSVESLAYSPGGHSLASGSPDSNVNLWNATTGQFIRTISTGGWVYSVAFSPDGSSLASGGGTFGQNGAVKVWDAASGALRHSFGGHRLTVQSISFSPGGCALASGAMGFPDPNSGGIDPGELMLWHPGQVGPQTLAQPDTGMITGLEVAPDGRTLISCVAEGGIREWDPLSREPRRTIAAGSGRTAAVVFSPDGSLLARATDKGTHLLESVSGKISITLEGHRFPVACAAFSPDGRILATGGGKPFPENPKAVADLFEAMKSAGIPFQVTPPTAQGPKPNPDPGSIQLSIPVGRENPEPGELCLWDVSTGDRLMVLNGHGDSVLDVAFRKDGGVLASASADRTIRVWDVASGELLTELPPFDFIVNCLAFNQDGTLLAGASRDGAIRIWDARSFALHAELGGHGEDVTDLVFVPHGDILISAGYDGNVFLWDTVSGHQKLAIRDHEITRLALSPDGRTLFIGDIHGQVAAWILPPYSLDLAAYETNHWLRLGSGVQWNQELQSRNSIQFLNLDPHSQLHLLRDQSLSPDESLEGMLRQMVSVGNWKATNALLDRITDPARKAEFQRYLEGIQAYQRYATSSKP